MVIKLLCCFMATTAHLWSPKAVCAPCESLNVLFFPFGDVLPTWESPSVDVPGLRSLRLSPQQRLSIP